MRVYIVQPGDTLYLIARRYGVSVEEIRRVNNLTSDMIIVGQRLNIPDLHPIYYTVRAGDTLYSLAQRFNTTVTSLMALNRLTSTNLAVGQRLRIPYYTEVVVQVGTANIRQGAGTNTAVMTRMVRGARLPVIAQQDEWYQVRLHDGRTGWISGTTVTRNIYDASRPIIGVLGFYTLEEGPNLPGSYRSFADHLGQLSETGLFMYRISAANPTQIEKFGTFTDAEVRLLVSLAHRNNIRIMPVVHNLLYRRGDTTINKNVVRELVSSPENRQAFIQNLINLIETFNFDGANIDIEDVYLEDSERLSAFYTELGAAMRSRGYFLSASVPSRTSDQPTNPFSAPFNYAAIGAAVDEFVVMLYNEHGWPGSGPGPVVSIGWMEQVLGYAMTKMPREKIMAAVSVFGFDFNLTTGRNTYVTYQMAMDLARQYNRAVIFDQATQTPMFAYTDAQGNQHEVWFENRASIEAKARKAWELGIRGIALWRLGMEDPAVWTGLSQNIVVRRY